jgi:hypothetical protein
VVARASQAVSLFFGVLSGAIGIVYLTVTAGDLPSWFPGYISHPTNAHHVARGWVLVITALISLAVTATATWALRTEASPVEEHDWDQLLHETV